MSPMPTLTDEQRERVLDIAVRTTRRQAKERILSQRILSPKEAVDAFIAGLRAEYPEIYVALALSTPGGRDLAASMLGDEGGQR